MPSVLVIEDTEELRDMMRVFLKRLGFEVLEAPNGLDGIKVAKASLPDLVILDLMMPVASGDFSLGFMRSTTQLKNTPVIIISAHPKAAIIAESLNAHCLPKPFGFPALKAIIEKAGLITT
jgi:DNA-binding response OmpR family regulator